MSIFNNNLLAGAGAQSSGGATYSIDQSIRFNPVDSTYMQRTHGAGGNVDLFTVSFWFKRNILGGEVFMFGSGANTSNTGDIAFNTSDQLIFWQYIGAFQTRLITTQVFRDTSAWYHCVVVYDSGNAVSTERARMYINGERITSFGTETYPSQNQDGIIGSNANIGFGRYISYGSSNSSQYFPGYLAEMHYVNGSALDPSSFAEYNSSNIWIPKEYSGSHGTGGFYIKGEDSSDLGNDSSGNGNDMTTSGLAAHDQVADSPTNNFCTLNPTYRGTGSQYGVQENGNLELKFSGAQNAGQLCTQLFTTGKWYWEMRIKAGGGSAGYFLSSGIAAVNDGYVKSDANMHGTVTGEIGVNSYNGECKFSGPVTKTYTEVPFVNGDILQVAVDTDNGAIYYGKNGTFMGSGDPTSGASKTNAGATWTPASYSGGWVPTVGALGGSIPIATMNFGQEGTFSGGTTAGGNSDGNGVGNFKYSVPSGYLALCTKNLGAD